MEFGVCATNKQYIPEFGNVAHYVGTRRAKVVSEIMSKLTSSVSGLIFKPIDTITFKTVKNFKIDIRDLYEDVPLPMFYQILQDQWTHDRLPAMRFERFETFSLYTQSGMTIENGIDLITQNSDLIDVEVSSIELSYRMMRRLVDALPKLKKVTLSCENERTVPHIVSLMQQSQLTQITVIGNVLTISELVNRVSLFHSWRIDSNWNGEQERLTFVRQEEY